MSIRPNTSKFNRVAETIATNCRNVEEVALDRELFEKISAKLKVPNNKKFRSSINYLWNKDVQLHLAVSKILDMKKEEAIKENIVKKHLYSDVLKGPVPNTAVITEEKIVAVSLVPNEEESKKKNEGVTKVHVTSKQKTSSLRNASKGKAIKQAQNSSMITTTEKVVSVSKLQDEVESQKQDENIIKDSDSSKKKTHTSCDVLEGQVAKYVENAATTGEKIVVYGHDQYMIHDVRGDGNCLFRSFSYCLYQHEDAHLDIRSKIVKFAVQNWSLEKELITSCHNKIYKDMAEYESMMGKDSEYGTDYELSVFIRMYDMMVTVFKYEDEKLKFNGTHGQNNNNSATLMFTGDRESGHWLVLIPLIKKNNKSFLQDAEDNMQSAQVINPVDTVEQVEEQNKSDANVNISVEKVDVVEKSVCNQLGILNQSVTKDESSTPISIKDNNVSVSRSADDNDKFNEVFKSATSICSLETHSSMSSTSMEVSKILSHAKNDGLLDKTLQDRIFDFDKCCYYKDHQEETNSCSTTADVENYGDSSEENDVKLETKSYENVQDTTLISGEDEQCINEQNGFSGKHFQNDVDFEHKSDENIPISIDHEEQSTLLTEERKRQNNEACDPYEYKSDDDPMSIDNDKKETDDSSKLEKLNKLQSNKFFKTNRESKRKQYDLKFNESDEEADFTKKVETDVPSKSDKEISEISSGSSTSESEAEDEEKSKTKKRTIYNIDIGEYDINSAVFKDSFGYIQNSKIRDFIKNFMSGELLCTCSLRFVGSIRRNREDIVAYAKCRRVNHKQRFLFYLSQLGEQDPVAKFTISSTNELKFVHDESDGPPVFQTLRGDERKEVQQVLKHQRVCSYVEEQKMNTNVELYKDGYTGKLRQYNTYCKIKSEANCADRLKLESLDLADLNQLWIEHQKRDDPFLRKTGNPLSATMYREAELDIAIEEKPLILHMDATGSYVRKPYKVPCKKIFYYVILFRGKTDIVKLAHLITCTHTVVSISEFLKDYKYFVKEKVNKWPIANVVTTDWSWVFIHGLSIEWNGMEIVKYLKIMYKHCIANKTPSKDLILIKLCYAHFMHMVSTTIKKKFPEYKEFKSLLLECMALLCLSRQLGETDMLFKNIIKLLSTPNKEDVKDYVAVILNHKSKHPTEMKVLEEVDKLSDDDIVLDDEDSDTIYRSSPFFKRYECIAYESLKDIDGVVDSDSDDENTEIQITNEFYAPKFVEHLRTKWMPYVVMWSALDLTLIGSSISRISNAYVESSNRTTKEIDFGGNSLKSIADRVRQLENKSKSTVASVVLDAEIKPKAVQKKVKYPTVQYDADDDEDAQQLQPRGKPKRKAPKEKKADEQPAKKKRKTVTTKAAPKSKAKTVRRKVRKIHKFPDTVANPVSEEKWNPRKKSTKGRGHAKGNALNKIMAELIKADNEATIKELLAKKKNAKKSQAPDMTNSNLQNDEVRCSKTDPLFVEDSSNKRKREVLTDITTEHDIMKEEKREENESAITAKKICTDNVEEIIKTQTTTDLKKFCNGLIRNENYYLLSKSSTPTVSRYTMRHSVSYEQFQLFAKEFSTLRQEIWIDGIVIDSFVATHIDEWTDVTYVPTDDSITISGDHGGARLSKDKFICRTKKCLKNNLFLPYLYRSHWRLLHIKIKERKIMMLDPYGNNSDMDRAVKALKYFIEFCPSDCSFSTLRKIEWEIEEVVDRPYQPTDDGYSCGSYVMHYLLCLGSGKPFDMNFDPATYRNEIVYTLLLKSENMEYICLNCSAETCNEACIKCTICKRKCHERCTFKAEVDTDDEEKVLKKKVSSESIDIPRNQLHTFVCKLCKRYCQHKKKT